MKVSRFFAVLLFSVTVFAENKPPQLSSPPEKPADPFLDLDFPKSRRLYTSEEVESLRKAQKALGNSFLAPVCEDGKIKPNGILNSVDEAVRKAKMLADEGALGRDLVLKNPEEVARLLQGTESEKKFGNWIMERAKSEDEHTKRLDHLLVVQKLLRKGVKEVTDAAVAFDVKMLVLATMLKDAPPAYQQSLIEAGKKEIKNADGEMPCSTAQDGQWSYFIELSQRYAAIKKLQQKASEFEKATKEKPEPPPSTTPHRGLKHGAGRPAGAHQ